MPFYPKRLNQYLLFTKSSYSLWLTFDNAILKTFWSSWSTNCDSLFPFSMTLILINSWIIWQFFIVWFKAVIWVFFSFIFMEAHMPKTQIRVSSFTFWEESHYYREWSKSSSYLEFYFSGSTQYPILASAKDNLEWLLVKSMLTFVVNWSADYSSIDFPKLLTSELLWALEPFSYLISQLKNWSELHILRFCKIKVFQ